MYGFTNCRPALFLAEIFAFNGGIFGGVLMSAFAVIMVTGIPIIIPVQEREVC